MHAIPRWIPGLAVIVAAVIAAAPPASAQQPSSDPGWSRLNEDDLRRLRKAIERVRPEEKKAQPSNAPLEQHLGEAARTVVREHYLKEIRAGRCPPGLVFRDTTCTPTRERRWEFGRPLTRTVVFHDLPADLVTDLPPLPPGRRYVRAGGDILFIANDTGIVMDAILDLGQ